MLNVLENVVIAQCPNGPTHCDDNLHEEGELELIFEAYQDIKGVTVMRHNQIQRKPAGRGKGAVQH